MKLKLLLILICLSGSSPAEDAGNIIDRLLAKFKLVNTYQANAVIRPDIPFLKMLPQKATVYFKQPDQFRVKTTGISILPKQHFDNIFTLLAERNAYVPVLTGREKLNDVSLAVLNIIPVADTSELILARLWVDDVRNLIIKAQLTTRTNGTIQINYEHGRYADYGLPDKIIFTIDVKKFKIPKAVAADINTISKTASEQEKQSKQGKITVTLSNYQINKPVPENIFKNR
jgi:hypothetical protein